MKNLILLLSILTLALSTRAQIPNKLPTSGTLSMGQIADYMVTLGEMTPAQRAAPFSLQLLNSLSHLSDKTAPYSISDWYGYGPPPTYCGGQTWMTSNLNVGTMVNASTNYTSTPPPYVYNNGIVEKYCYNNVEANCDQFGGLYFPDEALNFPNYVYNAMNNIQGQQGPCPAGYHIPTDAEFSRYEYCVDRYVAPYGTTPLNDYLTITGGRGANNTTNPGYKLRSLTIEWGQYSGPGNFDFEIRAAGNLYMVLEGVWTPTTGWVNNYRLAFNNLYYGADFMTSTIEPTTLLPYIHSVQPVGNSGGDNWYMYRYPMWTNEMAVSIRCIKN